MLLCIYICRYAPHPALSPISQCQMKKLRFPEDRWSSHLPCICKRFKKKPWKSEVSWRDKWSSFLSPKNIKGYWFLFIYCFDFLLVILYWRHWLLKHRYIISHLWAAVMNELSLKRTAALSFQRLDRWVMGPWWRGCGGFQGVWGIGESAGC